MELDEVSGEERQEKRTFACFWKGLHESVAIRRKSDVRAHCRANRQSESEMGQWNLGWRGSNDRRVYHSDRKWDAESEIVAPRNTQGEVLSELEKAREFPSNDVAENLKSAIKTHQDQGPSWTSAYASDDQDRDEDWSAVPDRDLTRKHVGCDGEEHSLADAKESESPRAVGAGIGSIAKNDRGAPTANSGDAAEKIIIIIFQSYCADARTDTKTFRTFRMSHQWIWEHRNAESKGRCN